MSKAFFSPGGRGAAKRTGKRAEILRRKIAGNPVRTGLPNNFGRQKRGRSCGPVSGLFFLSSRPRRLAGRKIIRSPRPTEKRPVPPQNSEKARESRPPAGFRPVKTKPPLRLLRRSKRERQSFKSAARENEICFHSRSQAFLKTIKASFNS